MSIELPWPEPEDAYADDGPTEPLVFTVRGVDFRVSPVNETGFHTNRRRFRVVCLACGELVHRATTGASSRVREHLQKAHAVAS